MHHISVALLIFMLPVLTFSQRSGSRSVCTESPKSTDAGDEIILTVCNHTHGMAPLAQPRLYFRLYRSGRLEYEVSPSVDEITGIQDHYSLLMQTTQVEPKQVDEIIRLGKTADFQGASAVYPTYQIWTDSWLESKVAFSLQGQAKTFVVNNFSPDDSRSNAHYPASVLEMLRKVWELRPPDYTPTVRDILINQPDFAATEAYTSSFMGHGFSVTYKTYKRMDCYRRESPTQITYSLLKIYHNHGSAGRNLNPQAIARGRRAFRAPGIGDRSEEGRTRGRT